MLLIKLVIGFNKNHNKPFGTGKSFDIEKYYSFINPIEFIEKHVIKSKPLLFKNAAKNWPAITRWTDDYFLSLNLSNHKKSSVHVESQKKENRSIKTHYMEFKDFIMSYNHSEIYLVDKLPMFLNEDLFVPWSLQCPLWDEAINQVLMWFSSGGTSSVVHTDDMDNINCLISGQKVFVLVDPVAHKGKIPLREEGAYSDIDVDRVDFVKFPGMETVDFQIVNMTAGDCLYIPKLWIHQVRSFNRNIAINIWFTKSISELIAFKRSDLERSCSMHPVTRKFFDLKIGGEMEPAFGIMDVLRQFVDLNGDGLLEKITQTYIELNNKKFQKCKDHVKSVIMDIFLELDHNKNSFIEKIEIDTLTSESISRTSSYLKYLKVYLESLMAPSDVGKERLHKDVYHYKPSHSEL